MLALSHAHLVVDGVLDSPIVPRVLVAGGDAERSASPHI